MILDVQLYFLSPHDYENNSGGYQISIGRLTKAESLTLYELYYEWLAEAHDVFDRAFILDVPPGPGCQVFDSFDDVFNWNLESYLKAKAYPEEIRKKFIYVHHFRTPQLWKIYTKNVDETLYLNKAFIRSVINKSNRIKSRFLRKNKKN